MNNPLTKGNKEIHIKFFFLYINWFWCIFSRMCVCAHHKCVGVWGRGEKRGRRFPVIYIAVMSQLHAGAISRQQLFGDCSSVKYWVRIAIFQFMNILKEINTCWIHTYFGIVYTNTHPHWAIVNKQNCLCVKMYG